MKIEQLKNLIPEDAVILKFEEGKKYILFINPNTIEIESLIDGDCNIDCNIIVVSPQPGDSVSDCVALAKISD